MRIESDFQWYFGKLSIGVVLLDGAYNISECNSEFRELVNSEEPVGASFIASWRRGRGPRQPNVSQRSSAVLTAAYRSMHCWQVIRTDRYPCMPRH